MRTFDFRLPSTSQQRLCSSSKAIFWTSTPQAVMNKVNNSIPALLDQLCWYQKLDSSRHFTNVCKISSQSSQPTIICSLMAKRPPKKSLHFWFGFLLGNKLRFFYLANLFFFTLSACNKCQAFFLKHNVSLFLSQFYISNISDNNDILRELEKYRYYKPYYQKKRL